MKQYKIKVYHPKLIKVILKHACALGWEEEDEPTEEWAWIYLLNDRTIEWEDEEGGYHKDEDFEEIDLGDFLSLDEDHFPEICIGCMSVMLTPEGIHLSNSVYTELIPYDNPQLLELEQFLDQVSVKCFSFGEIVLESNAYFYCNSEEVDFADLYDAFDVLKQYKKKLMDVKK